EQAGVEYAKQVGAPDGEGQLSALRAATAEKLIDALPAMEEQREFNIRKGLLKMAPIVDGWVIPDDPMTLMEQGRYNDVPLIVGPNGDEGTIFPRIRKLPKSVEDFNAILYKNFTNQPSAIRALYPAEKPKDIRRASTDILGDIVFVAPARYVARHKS